MTLLLIFSFLFATHDFHLSKSEIIFNPETSTIQVATNIFLDDLEEALALQGHEELKLFTDHEDEYANTYIATYLFENILIDINDSPVQFSFVGKEISEDLTSVWCYFESDQVNVNSEAQISNTVLLHLFDDQRNITILKKGNERGKHYILDLDDTTITKNAYH